MKDSLLWPTHWPILFRRSASISTLARSRRWLDHRSRPEPAALRLHSHWIQLETFYTWPTPAPTTCLLSVLLQMALSAEWLDRHFQVGLIPRLLESTQSRRFSTRQISVARASPPF